MTTYKTLVERTLDLLQLYLTTPAPTSNDQLTQSQKLINSLLEIYDGPMCREAVANEPATVPHGALASRTLPNTGSNHFFEVPNHNPKARADFERNIDLIHAALGMAGEVGEFCDSLKKAMFYGKPIGTDTKEGRERLAHLGEEAGDVSWYIAAPAARALGLKFENILSTNVSKLRLRYPHHYTDQAALARSDKAEKGLEIHPKYTHGFDGKDWELKDLSAGEIVQVMERYKKYTTEDGFYFDEDDRAWERIPELWQRKDGSNPPVKPSPPWCGR